MAPASERLLRVLVVDDHPMVRDGLRSMLRGSVSASDEAATGAEAFGKLAHSKPDLILLDLELPDIHGLTLLKRIKEAAPRTGVLIVTMHDEPEYVRQAMKLGAAGYVLKGVSRRELLAAVRAASEGEAVIAPYLLHQLLADVSHDPGVKRQAPDDLTAVERDLLSLISQGLTNKQIAERLHWSVATVKKYVQRILEKLRVSDRTQAAVEAVRRGLVTVPSDRHPE